MDIHLARLVAVEVGEAPTRFVLGIEIEQGERDLVLVEPLDKPAHKGRLADSTLAALGEDHAAGRRWMGLSN